MFKINKPCFLILLSLFVALFMFGCGSGGGTNGGDSEERDISDSSQGIVDDGINNLALVCPTILDLNPGMSIKYKSQNVHGGRGPSFILGCQPGAKQYWPISTYLATFPIYSIQGNEIGRFVVFDPGHRPYGNRSYSGLPGGYPADSDTLINSALTDGSTEIFVNVKDGICFKVNDPTVDQGTITSLQGEGPC